MKRVLQGDLVVIPRNTHLIDVFTGNGWSNHRVFQLDSGYPRLVKGAVLSDQQYSALCKLVRE